MNGLFPRRGNPTDLHWTRLYPPDCSDLTGMSCDSRVSWLQLDRQG